MQRVAVRATWVLHLSADFAACSSSDSKQGDEVEAIPFADTKLLSSADLAMLDSADPDGTLTFHALPASLAKVDRGGVILASASDKTPAGLLRIVKQVDTMDDGSVVLHTLNAPIQLAFRKLHLSVARSTALFPADMRDGSSNQGLTVQSLTGPGGQASKTETFDYPLFDGDGDPDTDDDRVVAGSTVDLLGDSHTATPAIALLGLDAVGKLRWAARYTLLESDGSTRASGFPGLELTDDGGVYVAGVAAPSGDDDGALWAFKAFAKDGSIDFDPARAEQMSLTASNLECEITASDLSLEQDVLSVTARSIDVDVEKLDLTTTTVTR